MPSSPQTIGEALAACAQALAGAGIGEARLEAELLVGEVTGRRQEWTLLHPDYALTAEQTGWLESLLARRVRREPLAYVLGVAEFYGLRFRVTPDVIVPRPETELLAEAVVTRMQGLSARDGRQALLALDVGAGCGAIAVVLAKQVPGIRVVAADVSEAALRLTQENAHRHGVAGRVWPVVTDLASGVAAEFDCVVANLPYIRREEFAELEPEVRDFEPRGALDGGEDGLELIRPFSNQLWRCLRTGGLAALEVGAGQAGQVANLLRGAGLSGLEVLQDYAGIQRVVAGWRNQARAGVTENERENASDAG